MKQKVTCIVCGKEEYVPASRAKTYKTCSVLCLSKFNSERYGSGIELTCPVCNNKFHVKPTQIGRRKYCCKKCQSQDYKTRYSGKDNPNFKNRQVDYDGYPIEYVNGLRVKTNRHVALQFLNLNQLPVGYHVHHRDCDVNNNLPHNLAVLTISDHKWLHKNFGNASLWAMMNDKITVEELASWSRDYNRAVKLLYMELKTQIGVFKSDELLETPEEDNQQPSLDGNIFEGSTTNNIPLDQ